MAKSKGSTSVLVAAFGRLYRIRRHDWLRFLRAYADGRDAHPADFNAENFVPTYDVSLLTPEDAQRLLEKEGVFIGEGESRDSE